MKSSSLIGIVFLLSLQAEGASSRTDCNVTCGPNKKGYGIEFSCGSRSGKFVRNGYLVAKFEKCQVGVDIYCDPTKQATRTYFTIFGEPYGDAVGEENGQDTGTMSCVQH